VPTNLKGTPPHLDFIAETVNRTVVAAESKLTEYLRPHRAKFAPVYAPRSWPSCIKGYVSIMQRLKGNPASFVHLDAVQLIKHAFGLASLAGGNDITLLYLFWEPVNRTAYPEFELHRQEAEQFAATVDGASVKFSWKSYPEIWHEWASSDHDWLKLHASQLLKRYAVKI
jgi:hypothetical protein